MCQYSIMGINRERKIDWINRDYVKRHSIYIMQSFGKGDQLQVIIRDETLWCGYDCRFQASQKCIRVV